MDGGDGYLDVDNLWIQARAEGVRLVVFAAEDVDNFCKVELFSDGVGCDKFGDGGLVTGGT